MYGCREILMRSDRQIWELRQAGSVGGLRVAPSLPQSTVFENAGIATNTLSAHDGRRSLSADGGLC